MEKPDVATERTNAEFSGTQSVFGRFAEKPEMNKETAFGDAGGLGGTARATCGTVSGAITAIGAKYGTTKAGDAAARGKTCAHGRACRERFAANNGSLPCGELPDGMRTAGGRNPFPTRCGEPVRDAVDIPQEIT